VGQGERQRQVDQRQAGLVGQLRQRVGGVEFALASGQRLAEEGSETPGPAVRRAWRWLRPLSDHLRLALAVDVGGVDDVDAGVERGG
jgi:hypothetical protein